MEQRIEIIGKTFEITSNIKEYVNKKLEKVGRLLGDVENIHVVLSFLKSARELDDRYIAEMTIHGKGYILRTEEHASDVSVAIDKSMDKLTRQIERFKGKRQRGRGDGLTAADVESLHTEDQRVPPAIVRRKQFILHPMDELEAIEQMKLIAHENFFIFYNVKSNSINVLYVRKDGSYGLIEPKLG